MDTIQINSIIKNIMTPNENFFLALRKLEGFKIKFKELHWIATTKPEHDLCGEIYDALNEFQDEFAEQGFMVYGNFQPNTFIAISVYKENIFDTLKLLKSFCIAVRRLIPANQVGQISLIDDFMGKVNKFQYLATL